ncbi:MAG: hypothetical protein WAS33_21685 [Candidatus Promineifilaceae bacterium]|nr:hypothetical protein [Anaerolineaceae bacterium]
MKIRESTEKTNRKGRSVLKITKEKSLRAARLCGEITDFSVEPSVAKFSGKAKVQT